jgi:hypothetical protein
MKVAIVNFSNVYYGCQTGNLHIWDIEGKKAELKIVIPSFQKQQNLYL